MIVSLKLVKENIYSISLVDTKRQEGCDMYMPLENLDQEKVYFLYNIEITEKEISYIETEKTRQKKQKTKSKECNSIILSRYSVYDQINILARGTQEEKDDMDAYVGGILDEYRTNGANADFTNFLSQ